MDVDTNSVGTSPFDWGGWEGMTGKTKSGSNPPLLKNPKNPNIAPAPLLR